MIYINTVQTTEPMQAIETSRDFLFFRDLAPQPLKYPTSEEMEANIKRYQMKIVIAGTMTGDLTRNNANLFSRSLLFIDFDDIQEAEESFLAKVSEQLKKINYCLYPTLKYRPDFLRYRLVLELSRPVNMEEHTTLLWGVCHELGIKFEPDKSNKTWSQGQGLPVKTEYTPQAKNVFIDNQAPLPVDLFLKKIPLMKDYKDEMKKRPSSNSGNYRRSMGTNRKYTGVFLEELFQDIAKGSRNEWWREKVDKMLSLDTPLDTIQSIMEILNNNFTDPLPLKELESIYLSRVGNHVKNGGEVY